MSNPNRIRVYYLYRCRRCGRVQHRGSCAKRCNLTFPGTGRPCGGSIHRAPGEAGKTPTTRPLRIARSIAHGL